MAWLSMLAGSGRGVAASAADAHTNARSYSRADARADARGGAVALGGACADVRADAPWLERGSRRTGGDRCCEVGPLSRTRGGSRPDLVRRRIGVDVSGATVVRKGRRHAQCSAPALRRTQTSAGADGAPERGRERLVRCVPSQFGHGALT